MSLFPYFFQPLRVARPSVSRFFDVALHPEHFASMFEAPLRMRQMMEECEKELPVLNKEGFQVTLDVQQFKPEEISVKAVENMVVIEGKHDERQDNSGLISRQFVRKFDLPKGVDVQKIMSSLSSDGLLTIKAPKLEQIEENTARVIEIQQTGPAKEAIKDTSESK